MSPGACLQASSQALEGGLDLHFGEAVGVFQDLAILGEVVDQGVGLNFLVGQEAEGGLE